MLVVDSESFELELSRLTNPSAKIVKMDKLGRGDKKETPESLRALIAQDSLNQNGTAKQIAQAYGVSESSVNAYKGGATSTDRMVNGKLDKDLVSRNEKIGKRAQNKMRLAIEHITKEKLEAAKVGEISQVAANMARVVEKTLPKVPENVTQNNIIFYSPQQIGEGNYDVIDVTADSVR